VVAPGEPPPRRLDLGGCRAGLDPEHVVRVALRHAWIISTDVANADVMVPADAAIVA
jgi:hypothetical protein